MKTIVLFMLFFTGGAVSANELCESEWDKLLGVDFQSLTMPEKIFKWKGKKNLCEDQGLYYHKLGVLLIKNQEFEEARSAFISGIKTTKKHRYLLELALADLPFQVAIREGKGANAALLAKAQSEIKKFINKYQDMPDGYALMTGVMLVKENLTEVIKYGEEAVERGGSPYAYRNLAIAYYQTEKDQQVIDAATKGIEGLRSLQGDKELMLSLALALSNIEKFESSLDALKELVKKRPSVQQDAEFLNVVNHIKSKYIAYKESADSA